MSGCSRTSTEISRLMLNLISSWTRSNIILAGPSPFPANQDVPVLARTTGTLACPTGQCLSILTHDLIGPSDRLRKAAHSSKHQSGGLNRVNTTVGGEYPGLRSVR